MIKLDFDDDDNINIDDDADLMTDSESFQNLYSCFSSFFI